MSWIDWIVLLTTLLCLPLYGMWKSRGMKNIDGYLLADKKMPWYAVGLSVMATQASAITFLSAPGLGYSDGLRFVQFYFGLPLAMVFICIVIIPIFKNLNVYTAYEYLENRFDSKTRTLTATLFLIQRGISTGITMYAPALILSTILHIDITITTFIMGGIVILYTVYGGAKAVSYTQMLQMAIIFSGLFFAAYMVVSLLPANVGFTDALHIAGKMNKLQAINTEFNIKDEYNIWSGIIGGFFLQLSYFGTDQSQVGRYLTGRSISQSRLGLVMNGLVKIPMQFGILLIGILVFTFYQFTPPPLFFNSVEVDQIKTSKYAPQYIAQEKLFETNHQNRRQYVDGLVDALHTENENKIGEMRTALQLSYTEEKAIHDSTVKILKANNEAAKTNDSNYIFLTFVTQYLPVGLVGLLIAIIFLAAIGATASGINALTSTFIIDYYKRFSNKNAADSKYLQVSRIATVAWGLFCMVVALYAGNLRNLIEAVNILGSLFYGVILGIFIVAFFVKYVKGTAVFIAAIIGEAVVLYCWYSDTMAYLWFNVIGCLVLIVVAVIVQVVIGKGEKKNLKMKDEED